MVIGRGIPTVLAAAALLAGCGGSDQAPAPRQQLAQAAPTLTPDALMDWAEANYHDYFPTLASSGTYLGYLYRAYSTAAGQTNYLGIKDGGIFVMGPGLSDAPWQVGTIAGYTCVVYSCGTSVTGTAAAGAPLAGVTITLKDSTNRSVTATTSVAGGYSIDTTGLNGPFLLQLATPAGQLYGVTADTSSDVVANLTPLTDLIVRSWYSVQGGSADNAFANPSLAPPPTAQQTAVMAGTVFSVMQLALNTANAGVVAPIELINKPFSANNTGIDQILDNTTISYGSAATVVVRGTTQQTSVIGYDTLARALTVSSTTVAGSNTTTSAISTVVPVQQAQASALNEIAAMLNQVGATISTHGAGLSAAHLAPYFDPGMIQDGLTAQQYTGMLASNFNGGQTVTVAMQRLTSLDAVAGRAEGIVAFTSNLGGQGTLQSLKSVFRKVGGVWLFSGNDRIAQIEVQAEASVHQGIGGGGINGPLVNVSVLAPPGAVSAVSAVGTPGDMNLSQHSTVIMGADMSLDQFNAEQGISGTLPPAGTAYTVTLSRADGSSVSYVEALNAFTTEGVHLTNPTGSALADAKLNGTLNVSWGLPSTYAVSAIQLSGISYTGAMQMQSTQRCETPPAMVSATGTTASLSIPATCNGSPVLIVDLMLIVTGTNGEHSETHYVLQ